MYNFAWTDSEILVISRIAEELLKRGRGDFKISFSLPMNWITAFDLLTNFRLQQPFGLDGTNRPPNERGEVGRYYYIESISYDFMNQKLSIIGRDAEYLLRQIMIVARCGDVPETWGAASDTERMYAYVGNCDADSFESDGSPLKRVAPCAVCE